MQAPPPMPAMPVFETAIPTDLVPPLPPFEVPAAADEGAFDDAIWSDGGAIAAAPLSGEVVIDPADDWAAPAAEAPAEADAPSSDAVLAPETDAHEARWVAVRDANIRPYVDWRPGAPVQLPPLTIRPGQNGGRGPQPQQHGGGQQHHGRAGYSQGPRNGGGGGGRRRRGRDRDRQRHGHGHDRHRDRGPRLPGFYNPGGD